MPAVIVYRDTILPKSEVGFMQRQYLGFETLQPVWVGRHLESRLPPGLFRLGPMFSGLGGALFKQFGAVPDLPGLRALGAVCVHAQFGRGGALALPLAERLGLPLVVTFHGGEDKQAHYRRFPVPAVFYRRMNRLKDYASAFVCVSRGVRDRMLARGFPAEKMVVLPIGTDRLSLEPRKDAGSGIFFVGRFVEMKGLPVLIAAIRLLRARGNRERVVLIGDGPDRRAVEHALGGIENVELRGWQSAQQVREALLTARALCVPSVRARSGEAEGLPSVAVEAMGLGVPVIASSQAGVETLVTDGVSGLMFPSRDAAALAGQIDRLVAAPDLCIALGAEAFRVVARDFDAMQQSRRLEALLLAAAASPSQVRFPPSIGQG
jgi:glycosyltransferase involved in cell wall biosynthesis